MLLKQATLAGIKEGAVTLQFRRWKRPTVTPGGTLMTSMGQLAIRTVDVVDLGDITAAEAAAAGFPTRESLVATLEAAKPGSIYRVSLSYLGADPRIALRSEVPNDTEVEKILGRLDGFDARSAEGAWTGSILQVIRARPRVRAAELAADVGMERTRFKTRVRRLKGLGLTESLEVGYQLSPRGERVLDRLERRARLT